MAKGASYQGTSSSYKGAGTYGGPSVGGYQPGYSGKGRSGMYQPGKSPGNQYMKQLMGQYIQQQQHELLGYLQQQDPYSGKQQGNVLPMNQAGLPGMPPGLQQAFMPNGMPGYGNGVTVIVINSGSQPNGFTEDDITRAMQRDMQGIMQAYGAHHAIAARYAMDAMTLHQQGYGQPGIMLKDFYNQMQKREPNNKEFYQGLEKLADKMSREQLDRAA